MKNGLSGIIITKNEEHDIVGCLSSLAPLCQEIILVDSGSTDKTLDLAKKFSPKIFHHDWQGYGPQKQFALDQAAGPWVINLDADERLTPALMEEIRVKISDEGNPVQGYRIPFHHYFLGRRLRFGGMQGETHLRLFKKTGASYGRRPVHEGISVPEPIGYLKEPIEHTSYQSMEEYKKKREEYTDLIAKLKFDQGKRFHIWYHLRLPFEFILRYIFKLGFLDGKPGLIYAWISSVYVWMKFTKLKNFK